MSRLRYLYLDYSIKRKVILMGENKGFTLAEVLITLGIIGVVAAITLPTLITNYKAIVLKNQFKEQYSRLAQALRRMADEEEIVISPAELGGGLSKYVAKYYNISQDCGRINVGTTGCIRLNKEGSIDEYKSYSGGKINFGYLDDGTLVLNDGTTLFFEQGSQATTLGYYLIGIDINGYKNKPNRLGHDLFVFKIEDNGELKPNNGECSKTSISTMNGYGCAKEAINNPDYFKNLPK